MDFKISDTNKGKKSLIYDGFIYRIDSVLKCRDRQCHINNERNKPRTQTISRLIQRLANRRTIVESRYLFYGFDNEIQL